MWFRTDTDAADDVLWDRLGQALGIHPMQAYGHYKAFEGRYLDNLARDQVAADLREIPDTTLERWANWTETRTGTPAGTLAGFAGVFRGLCADPATGELRGSFKRNQKLLAKQIKDAQKRRESSPSEDDEPPGAGTPKGTPAKPPRVPAQNPRANGYGNRTTPTPTPQGEGQATNEHYARIRAEVEAQLPDPLHAQALQALLRASHSPFAFLCTVQAILTGQHRLSPHPTPAQVGKALWDMHVNGKPPEVAVFHSYCEYAAREKPVPKGSTGTGKSEGSETTKPSGKPKITLRRAG